MKIAIVVHGRFHAFALAKALAEQGDEISVYTNYPKMVTKRFGLSGRIVKSFVLHGLLARVAHFFLKPIPAFYFKAEPFLHRLFSSWVSRQLQKETWDVVHVFSGVAEEILMNPNLEARVKLLVRGSAHILTQSKILSEEERRSGVAIERPSDWMIQRELREYALADKMLVLSTFAQRSFIENAYPKEKLTVLALGANVQNFRPAIEVIRERQKRILHQKKLRILTVGSFSYRKGAQDYSEIATQLKEEFEFQFVGDIPNEATRLASKLTHVRFEGRKNELDLPKFYDRGDLFIFPTLEDGYAVVLSQAQTAGLPIIATTNSCAPDIISEERSGWVVSIRDPKAFIERLRWCDAHRKELAQMCDQVYHDFEPRSWSQVAEDFRKICENSMRELR